MQFTSILKAITLSILVFSSTSNAADAVTTKPSGKDRIFVTKDGAIRGYDPVAYFTQGKPIKGAKDITFKWQEATWHFSSTANRDMFQKDPEHYAPLYGGYCAFGMSNGYKASIEPEAFTIVGNRLYLNYNLDIRKTWVKDQKEHITRADGNWPKLMNSPYKM